MTSSSSRSPALVRPGWASSLAGGLAAALAATGLMFLVRALFQVRTLPERVMEWVLFFVPLDQFEAGVARFGPAAKDYALATGIVVMVIALAAIGALAARFLVNPWGLLGLGLLFYLMVMGVILPVTGAGFFAAGLLTSPYLTNVCYLLVGLAYATVLLATRALALSSVAPATVAPRQVRQSRRAFVVGLASSAAVAALTAVVGRNPTAVSSSLPLAQVPAPTSAPPAAATTSVVTASSSAASTTSAAAPGSVASATTAVASTVDLFPKPPPPRQIKRDKDGALIKTPHPPGQVVAPITPNEEFYIVTKNAGGDPLIDPTTWRLLLQGEVNKPVQLDYPTLRRLPATRYVKTQECISNFTTKCELASFGCDLVSTVEYTGVKLPDLFAVAGGLKPGAVTLFVTCADENTVALPINEAIEADSMLAYEMNGKPLPYEHGYPAKLVAPGRYGYKNAKWVISVQALNKPQLDWFGKLNWNEAAIIRPMSRIDVPARGDTLKVGVPQKIGGITYGGLKGISKVEFSADGGRTWDTARFIDAPQGRDVWKRWEGSFTPKAPGALEVVCRATDGQGQLQIEPFTLTQPDGGAGWDRFELTVAA